MDTLAAPLKIHANLIWPGDVGVPVGTDLNDNLSPAASETVFTVSLQSVLVSEIVHVTAVSAPFLTSVKAHDLPAPGAVVTFA